MRDELCPVISSASLIASICTCVQVPWEVTRMNPLNFLALVRIPKISNILESIHGDVRDLMAGSLPLQMYVILLCIDTC